MGFFSKIFFSVFVVLVAFSAYKVTEIVELLKPQPAPKLEEKYWGPGNPKKDDNSIRPFKIQFSDQALQDLNSRLASKRPLPPPLEGINFQYGFNSRTLNKIINYWIKEYKWKEREAFLNKFPQYKTSIQGLDIHYIHVKPATKVKTVPILLLHGWPGSVREFYKLIPLLVTPDNRDFGFEVIVPSLPGYGFSDAAAKPGLSPAHIGIIFKNLMKRIGHDKFYIHGGDWGAAIGESMATLFPDNVLGLHSTMCFVETPMGTLKHFLGSFMPHLIVDKKYESLMYPIKNVFMKMLEESGYMHIQATKPDTVGVGLNDSPAGLLAYILEKFSTWTNIENKLVADGNLPGPFTYEDLLDNVMIYWISGSITTSMRLYSEALSHAGRETSTTRSLTTVPTACARFRHELMYTSEAILEEKFTNLVQVNDFDNGGHFAAFELPGVVATDIKSAVVRMMAKVK